MAAPESDRRPPRCPPASEPAGSHWLTLGAPVIPPAEPAGNAPGQAPEPSALDRAVLIADAAGHVLQIDTADPAGSELTVGGALGRTVKSLGPAEPWSTAAAVIQRVGQTRSPCFVQAQAAGGLGTWELSGVLLAGEADENDRIVVSIRRSPPPMACGDTALVVELESARGLLALGVAEAVRRPLFNLSATLDAFEVRFGKLPGHGRYVSILRGQLDRIGALVRELLEFGAAPDEGPRQVYPFDAIAAQALFRNRLLARRSDVQLVTEVPTGVATVSVDRRRMVRVLQTLVSGAVRHAPRSSAVILRAKRVDTDEGAWVECSVADSGPAFRPEDLPSVFEPFFSRQRGEVRLGLAVVRRIVEGHRGQIWAANRSEGGAVVTLRLPVAVQDLDAPSRP